MYDDHLGSKGALRPDIRRAETPLIDNKGGGTNMGGGIVGPLAKPNPSGIKRLPWDELQKRREKDLYFNCDERFTLGHKCKVRQVFLIEPVDEDVEDETSRVTEDDTTEISVHAMAGVNGPRTMQMG